MMSILAWQDALELEELTMEVHAIDLKVKSINSTGQCPLCKQLSSCIHSQYRRKIADLPWALKSMNVSLAVRRFRCQNPQCSQKIFSERPRGVH